jgi:hypothetical protein
MTSRWLRLGASVSLPFLLVASCSLVNAPDEVRAGSGGEGGEGRAGPTSSSPSSSSSASSGTGGMMMACTPGETVTCYDGPAGTEGKGICKAGVRTCDPMGAGFGPCAGQTMPVQEDCATGLVDEDCDGAPKNGCKPRVIYVSAVGPDASAIATTQLGTGAFEAFDLFDANFTTPTLEQLQQYDVALVTSNNPFMDSVAVGDVLADYYDLGGRVVVTAFALSSGYELKGRFGDPAMGYLLIAPSTYDSPMDSLGEILEPQSPLMKDVTALDTPSAYRNTGGEINGGIVVARWAGGPALVVRGVVQGRNRVDLNFFPVPSYYTGNHVELLRNALLFQ